MKFYATQFGPVVLQRRPCRVSVAFFGVLQRLLGTDRARTSMVAIESTGPLCFSCGLSKAECIKVEEILESSVVQQRPKPFDTTRCEIVLQSMRSVFARC